MRLYHYTNEDIKDKIKISFFGLNTYTSNSKRISNIKRSYFYIDRDKKEYFLNGARYCYIVELNINKLYNLNTDILGIVKNLKNTQDIFQEVKNKGYRGVIGSNGFNCVVLFKDIKIKEKIIL